ncbi:YciI family protein [Nocardiopsis sp. CC223A]|uniref:YciI family protein n=1 Tax=Nocardiopsis sp. CC223A TaxID=3044051 RepID=UPI00278C020E|nr:YciI family protein [Nocardiopsis sp. CC223A]
MPQYFLTMPHDTADEPTMESMKEMDPAELEAVLAAADAVNTELREAGVLVCAGGLHPPSTAITVDATGPEIRRTPGPFVDAAEYVGGFWIIDAPDEEAALGWAERCASALRARVEVRAFQEVPE